MSELFKALAQLQAELPKVGKSATAQYGKYADLADVSAVILPRLGKYGLAFMAKPTVADGQFILAYSLVHASGEREDGSYPLPANGNSQQLGSAITYARRYSLCAVTGVTPDEDDDGAAAGGAPWQGRTAGGSFENSTPAPRRQNSSQQRGQVSRPEQPEPAAEADPDEVDIDAQAYADEAHQALVVRDVEDIHKRAREAGKVAALVRNPAGGGVGKLAVYLDWRRKQLKETDEALNGLNKAAEETGFPVAELETHVKSVTGADLDSANAGQLRHATQVLRTMQGAAA